MTSYQLDKLYDVFVLGENISISELVTLLVRIHEESGDYELDKLKETLIARNGMKLKAKKSENV